MEDVVSIDVSKIGGIRIQCKRCGEGTSRPLFESHSILEELKCRACGETTANKHFTETVEALVKIIYELDGTANGPKLELLS